MGLGGGGGRVGGGEGGGGTTADVTWIYMLTSTMLYIFVIHW